nr:hypothetical protein Iba_chr08dCG10160 [Ipomoea batatas]
MLMDMGDRRFPNCLILIITLGNGILPVLPLAYLCSSKYNGEKGECNMHNCKDKDKDVQVMQSFHG